MRNGLNIAAVSELVHEIQAYPEEALIRLECAVRPLGQRVSEATVGTLTGGTVRVARDFRFLATQPRSQQTDTPSYEEHLLIALGGCVLVTFVQGCSARGFTIVGASVEVSAAFVPDSAGRPLIDRIAYRYDVDCDGPPETLLEIATIVSCLSPNHRTFVERGSVDMELSKRGGTQTIERKLERVTRAAPPAKAESQRALVSWRYGTQLTARVGQDLDLLVDQPKQYLGLDSAPNPQEYLLAAAGAELAHEIQREAQRRDIELREVAVRTAGSLHLLGITNVDESAPVRVHDIVQRVELGSPASEQDLADLVLVAAQRSAVLSAICEEHEIDVKVACRSEDIGGFRSDGAALIENLAELSRRKREAAKAAASAPSSATTG